VEIRYNYTVCVHGAGSTAADRLLYHANSAAKKRTLLAHDNGGFMADDLLFDKIKKLIADKLEIDDSKVTLDASFRQDLGADSLDTYELVYAIEEELDIKIPDEEANKFETVRDAYDFIIKSQKE
jgi:acyl carrier protein